MQRLPPENKSAVPTRVKGCTGGGARGHGAALLPWRDWVM